jgi:hypothetical protein
MLTAAQYRAKAAEYAELLKAASLPAEVHEFRRLERSYLMLAENEEWMADNRDKINTRGADENSYGDAILAPSDRVFDDTNQPRSDASPRQPTDGRNRFSVRSV